jgi:predicted methyltransferase MtxX (methanogen marker protein 4)
MDKPQSFGSLLLERARRKKRRIGIGVTSPAYELLAGLRTAEEFCEPVLYGSQVTGFTSIASPTPEDPLFTDLESGVIDAAVRGQIHATPFRERFVRPYGQSFQPVEEMITVLEFPGGKPLLVSPVSNLNMGAFEEKEKLLKASIRFCRLVGLPVKIGLLAQCRAEDLMDAPDSIKEIYRVTEKLVERYCGRFAVKNYGIDFEKAFEDDVTILIEPNGTTGNQVVRTLYFLNSIRFYGAPYMNAVHVVVETFKNAKDFPDVLMLAASMANAEGFGENAR